MTDEDPPFERRYTPDCRQVSGGDEPKSAYVWSVIIDFAKEIKQREVSIQSIEKVLKDDCYLKGDELGQKPERFTEDCLVFRLLDVLGYKYTPRPMGRLKHETGIPDFRVDNVASGFCIDRVDGSKSGFLIGENKSPNRIDEAREDVLEYLNSTSSSVAAIATDGISWELHNPSNENPLLKQSIREPIRKIVNKEVYETASEHDEAEVEHSLEEFMDSFSSDSVEDELMRR
jgi:hypothetical protein